MDNPTSWLFQDIPQGITLLEAETYIYRALSTQGIRPRYSDSQDDVAQNAVVTRWPVDQFPLKVAVKTDYGCLFNPVELKEVSQWVERALEKIATVDPDLFRFEMTMNWQRANIVIRYRRRPERSAHWHQLELGADRNIRRAEIVVNIPKHPWEERLFLEILTQLLRAMGVYGASDDPLDTGALHWSPNQRILSPRDRKTLQLLYRCPLGMTRQELWCLWQAYQKEHLSQTLMVNDTLLTALDLDMDANSVFWNDLLTVPTDLSLRELAHQKAFHICLKRIKTA